ncbi:MAG TPA: DUF4157 domain-containing protein, partial [Hanamia sp.]|nr:DUF4157 domain-containing protein [Hanamia sp.]
MQSLQHKNITPSVSNKPFFQRESAGNFFGKNNESFFRASPIQAKLTVNQPGDIYEKEADAMADKVVQRLSEPGSIQKKSNSSVGVVTPLIQKKCAHCEEEEKLEEKEKKDPVKEKIQKKPVFESNAGPPDHGSLPSGEGRDEAIQRKCAACEKEKKLQKKCETASQPSSANIESSLIASKGSGMPLPSVLRAQMENSFDADFSNVRIHNEPSSVQMNRHLNAQAFTHGSDVYFNAGKYDTGSNAGKHLLAHELTHVVQQK